MSEFETRAFCPDCGFNCYAPFGDASHSQTIIGSVCPKCGHEVSSHVWDICGGFVVETVRWVTHEKRKWWNPFTWKFHGHWVDREGNTISYPEREDEDG